MRVFQVGDRVRLKAGRHHAGYQQGEMGTIAAQMPSTTRFGVELYEVEMDEDEQALRPAFYADELELME
jgi:hypothetical protein